MASDSWTTSPIEAPGQRRSNRRLVLWLVLVAPLLVYLLIVPVRARLDRGVIERHLPYDIWRATVEGLPDVGAQWLLELAFIAGGLVFVAGTLVLIWLAMDEGPPRSARASLPAQIEDVPEDQPALQPVT